MKRDTKSLTLFIFACAWITIGAGRFFSQGWPQMISEWRNYFPVKDNLQKRDVMIPGWAECVRVVREKVPPGSELVFISDLEKERYAYLHLLLNYEIFPLRNFPREVYLNGVRPRFVVIFLRPPQGVSFENYRALYQGSKVELLERIQ